MGNNDIYLVFLHFLGILYSDCGRKALHRSWRYLPYRCFLNQLSYILFAIRRGCSSALFMGDYLPSKRIIDCSWKTSLFSTKYFLSPNSWLTWSCLRSRRPLSPLCLESLWISTRCMLPEFISALIVLLSRCWSN